MLGRFGGEGEVRGEGKRMRDVVCMLIYLQELRMIREGLLQHSSLCIICVKLLHFEALLTRYNIT